MGGRSVDYDDLFPEPAEGAAFPFGPHSRPYTEVSTLSDRNATVASIDIYHGAEVINATGSAKREQGDVYDREIGELYAIGRAFAKLARELKSRADKKVKEAYPESVSKAEEDAKQADEALAALRDKLRDPIPVTLVSVGNIVRYIGSVGWAYNKFFRVTDITIVGLEIKFNLSELDSMGSGRLAFVPREDFRVFREEKS